MCLRTIYPLKKANILFIILFTLFICFAKHFSSRSQDVSGRRDPREVQSPHSTDKKLHGPWSTPIYSQHSWGLLPLQPHSSDAGGPAIAEADANRARILQSFRFRAKPGPIHLLLWSKRVQYHFRIHCRLCKSLFLSPTPTLAPSGDLCWLPLTPVPSWLAAHPKHVPLFSSN